MGGISRVLLIRSSPFSATRLLCLLAGRRSSSIQAGERRWVNGKLARIASHRKIANWTLLCLQSQSQSARSGCIGRGKNLTPCTLCFHRRRTRAYFTVRCQCGHSPSCALCSSYHYFSRWPLTHIPTLLCLTINAKKRGERGR